MKNCWIVFVVLFGASFWSKSSIAQSLNKVTCYPGIQVQLEKDKWITEYEKPGAGDMFGAYITAITKTNSPDELFISSFPIRKEQSVLDAFKAKYALVSSGLIELEVFNDFQILKNADHSLFALRSFSPSKGVVIALSCQGRNEKGALKAIKKILKYAKLLSPNELDIEAGYPLKNYLVQDRVSFYEKRIEQFEEIRVRLELTLKLIPWKEYRPTFNDMLEFEQGFSFVAHELERLRLNKGDFTERECLDILFLPQKEWQNRIYWDLQQRNFDGYSNEFPMKYTMEQAAFVYAQLTGDTLSFNFKTYPKDLPWRRFNCYDYTENQSGIHFRAGRTTDSIHFYRFKRGLGKEWEKSHTEIKRPFPQEPYYFNTNDSRDMVLVDPDFLLFFPPWKIVNTPKLAPVNSYPKVSIFTNIPKVQNTLLLPSFPEYYKMVPDDEMEVEVIDYLPKDRKSKVFIFPPVCRYRLPGFCETDLVGNVIFSELGPFNVVATDAGGAIISGANLSPKELQDFLLKVSPKNRYYYTGITFLDANLDGKKELVSGWFNDGNFSLVESWGIENKSLSPDDLKKIADQLNLFGFRENSKEEREPRFKRMMNKAEFQAYSDSLELKGKESIINGGYADVIKAGRETVEDRGWDDAPRYEEELSYAQEEPTYPNGYNALVKEISSKIVYPKEMKKKGIEGKVIVSYVVEKNGTVSEIRIERGIKDGELLEQEAIRVMKSLSHNFSPGKMNGAPVRMKQTIPIFFRLY